MSAGLCTWAKETDKKLKKKKKKKKIGNGGSSIRLKLTRKLTWKSFTISIFRIKINCEGFCCRIWYWVLCFCYLPNKLIVFLFTSLLAAVHLLPVFGDIMFQTNHDINYSSACLVKPRLPCKSRISPSVRLPTWVDPKSRDVHFYILLFCNN